MSFEIYGRYQLLKKLATGGMAQIYLARHLGPEGFEKLLVVKRILPHLAENGDFVTMFLDEARIAARLNHPNIVQIFDLGAQDDSYFIAMEFIHGEDVRQVWKQADRIGKPIPIPLICRIIIEACSGLDYAHKKLDATGRPLNIVHRDISPQNILLSFEGGVKVVDFGIAKAADQATVTQSGVLKGKFSYMSPEQATGRRIDCRSDIFALGVVLYELLTGKRLFKRSSDVQTLNAVSECVIAPPSEINSRVPVDLDGIVMKALAKDRASRFSEARELGAALESWLLTKSMLSSTAALGEYLREIYAQRLEREKEEGRLLVEAADSSHESAPSSKPPASDGRTRRSKPGLDPKAESRSEPEATAAARPSRDEVTRARPPPKVDPAFALHPVEASVPTQPARSKWPRSLAVVGLMVLLGVIGVAAVTFEKPDVALHQTAIVTEAGITEDSGGGRPLPERVAGLPEALEDPPIVTSLLTIDSRPSGAEVYLNGEAVGVTPYSRALAPKTAVEVRLELSGRPAIVDRFAVGDGPEDLHRYEFSASLAKPKKNEKPNPSAKPGGLRGTVRFIVKPWALVECPLAQIRDTTPFQDQQVPVGDYSCTFTNPEFPQQTKTVRVEPNATVKVQVNFHQ